MKRIWLAGLMAATLIAGGAPAGNIAKRQQRQQKRIAQGVNSGELTARETARLERQEARLNKEIARDRADGGGLSVAERRKITRQQNRESRRIYRQKHDGQTQP